MGVAASDRIVDGERQARPIVEARGVSGDIGLLAIGLFALLCEQATLALHCARDA